MYYYYNYEYLLNKISAKYEQNTLLKNIQLFCREVSINLFRFKGIINNKNIFSQNDICRIVGVLELTDDDIRKCFFKSEVGFKTKEKFIKYLKTRIEQ